jgi:hypothetical protein
LNKLVQKNTSEVLNFCLDGYDTLAFSLEGRTMGDGTDSEHNEARAQEIRQLLKALLSKEGLSDGEINAVFGMLGYTINDERRRSFLKSTISSSVDIDSRTVCHRVAHFIAQAILGRDADDDATNNLENHYYIIIVSILGNAIFATLLALFDILDGYIPRFGMEPEGGYEAEFYNDFRRERARAQGTG